jgi:CRISPR/Cas system-associated endonuclease Cas1
LRKSLSLRTIGNYTGFWRYKGAAVTSAAVALAVEKGIDIVFFEAKIRNQSFLLKILAKDRNNEQLKNRAEKLMSLIEKLECGRTIE